MEEILYLEADEEITSVIDKLDDLTGHTVALVVPKHAQLVSSVVNLRLLLAEAKKRKKTIVIVTQDKTGTKLASQVGIPVYASVTDESPVDSDIGPRPSIDDVIELDEPTTPLKPKEPEAHDEPKVPVKRYDEAAAEAKPATAPKKSPLQEQAPVPTIEPSRDEVMPSRLTQSVAVRKPLLVGAGVFVVAALLGVGYWFYWGNWQAVAVLSLESEPFQEKAEILVSNSLERADASLGQIPGQRVEAQVSKSGSAPATGTKDVGAKASGTMTISNRLGEPLVLASGTRFSRDGLVVLSTEAVTVGAASVALDAGGNVVVKPGSGSVKVEAAASGDQYNVSPNEWTVTSLTSTQQDKVTASNQVALSGGLTKEVKVVTAEDIEKAKLTLVEQSTDELLQALQHESEALTILKEGAAVEVVESSSDKQPNDEADSVNVTASIRARAMGFRASDYQSMVVERVKTTVPTGKQLVVAADDAVETSVVSADVGQGLLKLSGTLHTRMVAAIDQAALTSQVTGKTVTEAQRLLGAQDGVLSATITIRPAIRTTLPSAADRITLQLNGN